jgi:hypothetical protein
MANTTIQLKRSSVAGKQPNTSTLSIGELAINITDKKLYSSDGSNIFEPAANVSTINITGGLRANGSLGSNGQILLTTGTTVYWANNAGSGIPASISGFPIGDYEGLIVGIDAFGVAFLTEFDCNSPSILYIENLGALA